MNRFIAVALFTCCAHLATFALPQNPGTPASQDGSAGVEQALQLAHRSLASVPDDARIDALAELVTVASRTKNPHTKEWLTEVDQLAQRDNDLCRQARYQARMIQVINNGDPRAALDRLAQSDSTCPDALSTVASRVFPAMYKQCAARCADALAATADHLGQLGSYPFGAVYALSEQLKAGEPAASLMFMRALAAYRNSSVLSWRAHRDFLALVERQRTYVPRPAVVEAVSAAINRISSERTDTGLQHLRLAGKEGAQVYNDRDDVVSELYRLAAAVDDGLAKQVVERWPNAPKIKIDNSKMTAGVSTGNAGPLPKSAQLFLEVEQAKQHLADSDLASLRSSGLTAPARVAMLAWRASNAFSVDQLSAAAFLKAAADGLDKLDERMSQVLTAPYVVEAAVACGDLELASKIAQLQFGTAMALLREIRGEKPMPVSQTPVYFPLRDTIIALRDLPLAITCLGAIEDNELKARLLVAAAESLSRPRR